LVLLKSAKASINKMLFLAWRHNKHLIGVV